MKPSVYAIAKALESQHGFDFDVAFLSAWYGNGNTEIPEATTAQIASRMQRVKWVPAISEAEAVRMRQAYGSHQGHGHCKACEMSESLRRSAEAGLRRMRK